jgi:hypothetical protein
MDAEIAATPMPVDLCWEWVRAACADCSKESDVRFHIFGLKCAGCGS